VAEQTQGSIRRFSLLDDIPSDIKSQLSYKNTRNLFASFEWFSCLARYGFTQAPKLALFASVGESGRIDNRYLLCLREDNVRGRLAGLTNFYTVRFQGFAGADEPPPAVVSNILESLLSSRQDWNELEFRYLPSCGVATELFRSALVDAGYKLDLFHDRWNWYSNVEGLTFADYWSSRPGRLRNTVRRKSKLASDRYHVRFEEVTRLENLPEALADYQRVYERSWKTPEALSSFIPNLMRACAKLGILRLGILYLDDVPVATQFWIVGEGKACIYKLSHDREYDSLSVGSLLTARMFEHVIDGDRVSEIDFGVGDENYKRDWMEMKRQLVGIHAFNPDSIRGMLLSAKLSVRDMLRKLGLRSYTPANLVAPNQAVDYEFRASG